MKQTKHLLRMTAADVLEAVLPYTRYEIDESEYLGFFDGELEQFFNTVEERGYHYQLFAAEKSLKDGTVDDGSFARIPVTHPREADGTKLGALDPGECQYHIHPFETENGVELYGHYEIHPYPWKPFWDIERPYPRHYRPTWDRESNPKEEWTYLRGVVDERVGELIYDER